MRTLLCVLLFINGIAISAITPSSKDSLLRLEKTITLTPQKVQLYRNLADLCNETPEEIKYLRLTYREAMKAKDLDNIIDALRDITRIKIHDYDMDSAVYYMDLIKESAPAEKTLDCLTYLRMIKFDYQITEKNGGEAIKEKLENHETNHKKTDQSIYTQIERAFITGNGLIEFKTMQEAIPYINTAYTLATSLPFKEGYKFQVLILRVLTKCYSLSKQNELSIELSQNVLQMHKKYYETFYQKQRPFFNINSIYIRTYVSLILNIRSLPIEKTNQYLQRVLALSQNSPLSIDRYNRFLCMNNYYLFLRNYPKALETNDSLIKYARAGLPYTLPVLYNVSSQIHEVMGNYKLSLYTLKQSHQIKDSLNSDKMFSQLSELQVKYDVDKLNYENVQLEVKNKRTMLIALSCVLIALVFLITYLFRNLKKEKRMQQQLLMLHTKAEEGEKMKTVFINSMCHEIRTPLNAIVGFSELINDESIDAEMRKSFPELIKQNTTLLTSLINDMLEVANLDSSEELFPCETVSLKAICQNEIERLKDIVKPKVSIQWETEEADIQLQTHEKYLALVVGHLLDNANKFTQQGEITLRYTIHKDRKQCSISVSDSGCGIPAEKYELVFKLFTKLDSFTQGNGLGLYLCRNIMKRLSGDIYIDSTYTKGTRFILTLPIVD